MERKRNNRKLKGIENFQCNGDVVSSRSALLFGGRIILKKTYLQYQLLSEEEIRTSIEMPEESFLSVLPRLESEGLDVVEEFIKFSTAGISVEGTEGGYAHGSREKLALLFIICNAELEKPLKSNLIVIDELKSIKKLSDLVDWISNMQNEKDMRRVLEREHTLPTNQTVKEPEEKLLGKQQLSDKLGISPRTIDRHPLQFKPIMLGDRKFFKLSECTGYQKKRGL